MSRSRSALALGLAALAATATTAAGASPASADDGVVRTGSCSGATDWKLKASPDDGRLEVELEVDGRRGHIWTWRLTDNGALVARGRSTTGGPSGSFEVERRTADRPGVDAVRATARDVATGETCVGSLRL